MALATISHNNLISWLLKKVISNIAISANRELTMLDEKEIQIHYLKSQLANT